MKNATNKSLLLTAMIMLTLSACKKEEVKPQPTIEEINAQHKLHYGRVVFYSGDININPMLVTIERRTTMTAHSYTPPGCDAMGFRRVTLLENTPTAYTVTPYHDTVPRWTGTVIVARNECRAVEIK